MNTARSNWPAIAVLVLVGVSAALEFAKVSAVFDAVAAAYAADDAAAAWFVSLPAIATIVFGVTGSVLAARIGFRRALLGALGLAVLFSAVQSTLPALPVFLATRVLDGAVQLGIVIAAPVLILKFAAPQARAFAMALWGTFFGFAFALAGWVAPALVDDFGLWSVFLAHALFAAILAVIVWRWLPRVPGDDPQSGAVHDGFLRAHLQAYRSARSVLPGAIFIFHTTLYAVFVLFVPAFAPAEITPLLLVWMPLMSIVGTIAAGVVTGRLASPPLVLIIGFIGLVVSIVLIALSAQEVAAAFVWSLVLMLFSGLIQGASFSLMPALSADPEVTARSNGVLMQLGNLGTLIGPPLFAVVIAGGGVLGFGLLAAMLCAAAVLVSLFALRLTGRRPVSA